MTHKDQIYRSPLNQIPGFRFDQAVVDVFADMIQRSVPGYEAIIRMTGELAGRYAQPGSKVYDLGCSLGASLLSMHQHVQSKDVELVGIDNSTAMLDQCQRLIKRAMSSGNIALQCDNIESVALEKASVVVLNFTLQFVPLSDRPQLIEKIFDAMVPGGVLIVSEKICFSDSHHQQLMTELHENFKRANGYSELEIAQKRTSLENVLIPETLEAHLQRFEQAGFGC
jgi:tRNA (cmo5U34)-methyltransferase